MAKDNLGLVAFAQQALAAGTGYVYGTFGQLCTAALLDQKARQYPADNLAGGTMRTVGNKWLGRRVTDCIGLIKYFLMADKYGDNPTYLPQYDSLNADDLFKAAKESGPISTLPEIPGMLLHMSGHVGVYIGGGYAIEAAGTANGVIKTKVAGRGWDHWYKCIWLSYAAANAPEAPAVKFDTTAVTIAAGGVYQLKTTSAATPKLTVAHPGVVQLLPRYRSGNDDLWWIVAVGKPGQGVGIYCNDPHKADCVVNIK